MSAYNKFEIGQYIKNTVTEEQFLITEKIICMEPCGIQHSYVAFYYRKDGTCRSTTLHFDEIHNYVPSNETDFLISSQTQAQEVTVTMPKPLEFYSYKMIYQYADKDGNLVTTPSERISGVGIVEDGKAKLVPVGCQHKWASYQGLRESFEYCTTCDERK